MLENKIVLRNRLLKPQPGSQLLILEHLSGNYKDMLDQAENSAIKINKLQK
jgi:hypothetical protein